MLWLRSRVGPKGQAVIPKPLRDQVGIAAGDEVFFGIRENEIVVRKKDGKEALEEFLSAFPKRRLPKKIDWDADYSSQFG